VLSNVHILENCLVDGTVSAKHIEGDIAKIYVLKGQSVYISPQKYPLRVLSIFSKGNYGQDGMLYFNGIRQRYDSQVILEGGIHALIYTIPENTSVTIESKSIDKTLSGKWIEPVPVDAVVWTLMA
ncbi:hypothetical protein ACIU3Q_005948, partial [Salmonella enterica subsp. enterica serovar Kokomlemle]